MNAKSLSFKMHAARAVFTQDTGSLSTTVDLIEETLERLPDLTFDLVKGFLDSVCKTVLLDLGHPADPNWDTPKLVKETVSRLRLVTHSYSDASKAEASLKKLTGGLSAVVQGICELRNHHGMTSHGHDGQSERLGDRQALLAAQAVDVVASYVYRCHREATAKSPGKRVYYEDHQVFNTAFDAGHTAITIDGITFEASRVLFMLDREAYREALLASQATPEAKEFETDEVRE